MRRLMGVLPLAIPAVLAFAPGCVKTTRRTLPPEQLEAPVEAQAVESRIDGSYDPDTNSLHVSLWALLPPGAPAPAPRVETCEEAAYTIGAIASGVAGAALLVVGSIVIAPDDDQHEGHDTYPAGLFFDDEVVKLTIGIPLLSLGGALDATAIGLGIAQAVDEPECTVAEDGEAPSSGDRQEVQVDRFSVEVIRGDGRSTPIEAIDGVALVPVGDPLFQCPPDCPVTTSSRASRRPWDPEPQQRLERVVVRAHPDPGWLVGAILSDAEGTIDIPLQSE
jgi:hypothetical protein